MLGSSGKTYTSPFCLTARKFFPTAALLPPAFTSATVTVRSPSGWTLSTTRSPVTSVMGYLCVTWFSCAADPLKAESAVSKTSKASTVTAAPTRPARRVLGTRVPMCSPPLSVFRIVCRNRHLGRGMVTNGPHRSQQGRATDLLLGLLDGQRPSGADADF